MKTKKNTFNCDLNGGIMVVSALRYALGRHTYVPGAVIDWISLHWDSLDSNTKTIIVRDVFEYLYRDYSFKNDAQFIDVAGDYDNKEWSNFGVDKYWKLDYNERKSVDLDLTSDKDRARWFAERLYGTQPA
jgi:hypothetical protein